MTYEFFDHDGQALHYATLAEALQDKNLYQVNATNAVGTHEYLNTGAGWKDARELNGWDEIRSGETNLI